MISFRPQPQDPTPGGGPPPPPPPPRPPPPPPQVCLDLWNTYEASELNWGIHFYADHGMRKAWVYLVADQNPQNRQRCAAVMVVPASDPYYDAEYGTDGELSQPGPAPSWGRMDNTGWFRSFAAQDAAPTNANASLDVAGKLAPL